MRQSRRLNKNHTDKQKSPQYELSKAEAARDDVVVIPWDYIRKPAIVPICIRTVDANGSSVYRGWIDAVPPIAGPLRALAKNVLGDAWKVSELTEYAVHRLSAKYGEDLGDSPSKRIYSRARWHARHILVGGKRRWTGLEAELTDHALAALAEPGDFAKAFEDQEYLERLKEVLETNGRTDIAAMLHLYLSDSEDAAMFHTDPSGQERNSLMHRFLYNLRKGVKLLERKRGRR